MTELYSAKHHAEKSRKWATGSIEECPDGSAKYWADEAERIAGTIGDPANRDLSNLTDAGQAKFDAKQNVLTFDAVPTLGSINPVTSGGIKANVADIKLQNTGMLSNYIASAPNGIVTFSGNTITVKGGLSFYAPNGKESDGTLKSIYHVIPSDLTMAVGSGNATPSGIVVNVQDQVLTSVHILEVRKSLPDPSYAYHPIYIPAENKMYISNGSVWEEFIGLYLGQYEHTSGQVTSVNIDQPTSLLKKSDCLEIMQWGLPDYTRLIDLGVLPSQEAPYTCPFDLEYTCAFRVSTPNQSNLFVNGIKTPACQVFYPTGNENRGSVSIRLQKGDVIYWSLNQTDLGLIYANSVCPLKGIA